MEFAIVFRPRAVAAFVVALTTSLLAGCASAPPAGLHGEGPLTATDGAMIVRIALNAPSAGSYFKNWGQIFINRVSSDGSDGTLYVIPASLDAASRSALFVATLPQGRYRFTRLSSSSYSIYRQTAQWINVAPSFPTFDVSAGHLTDVGAIVQTADSGSSGIVHLTYDAEVDHTLASEMIRELSPRLLPLLSLPVLGWSPDKVDPNAHALDGRARFISMGISDLHALSNGDVLAGSYDGIVKSGRPDSPALAHDIGQRVSIEAVTALADGSWVAGGEFGVIDRSTDGGNSWKSVRGDLPYGLISSVNEIAGYLVATVLRDNHAMVATHGIGFGSAATLERRRHLCVEIRPVLGIVVGIRCTKLRRRWSTRHSVARRFHWRLESEDRAVRREAPSRNPPALRRSG